MLRRNPYPDVDELVVAEIKEINEVGAYVTLPDYGDKEGLIQTVEISRRGKIIVRKGGREILSVVRVDADKGYIDLSRRRVTQEDREVVEAKLTIGKKVHKVAKDVAAGCNIDVRQVYDDIIWKLSDNPFDDLVIASESDDTFNKLVNSIGISTDMLGALRKTLDMRVKVNPELYVCYFELTCFTYEGIDAIKAALLEGKKIDSSVDIRYEVAPLYVAKIMQRNGDIAIDILNAVYDMIELAIKKMGGAAVLKLPPHKANNKSNEALKKILSEYKPRKKQTDGDSSSGGSDVGSEIGYDDEIS